jgi:transcription elongation factor
MWLISLIILALLAFFIVKYITSQSERKRAEQERLGQSPGIEGSLDHQAAQAGSSTTSAANSGIGSVDHTEGAAARSTNAHGTSGQGASVAAAGAAVTAAAGASHLALNSGNTLEDVREMIKILNLAEPDATRLSITAEQLRALRNADQSAMPSESVLDDLADRLRKMLA